MEASIPGGTALPHPHFRTSEGDAVRMRSVVLLAAAGLGSVAVLMAVAAPASAG
jgi:hypothetical protein